MATTLIEEYENELKRKADNEKERADKAEQEIEQIKQNAKKLNLTNEQMSILFNF